MKRRCISILFGFGLALLLLFAARPAAAAGVVGNGTPQSCTEAALDAALAGGGLVTFDCGPAAHAITVTGAKVIVADTSLDGGSLITLSGGFAVRVFTVNAGAHLSLANLAISAGVGIGGSGGGVANFGSLTVANCSFVANHADYFGGAILNYGTLDLAGSYFTENFAGTNGGAIDTTGTATVTRSTFEGNTAGFRGGGINNYLGTLTVVESRLTGNYAGAYGGGITNDGGTATIQGTSVLSNMADDYGAGIRNSGTLALIDSTLADNHAANKGGAVENAGTLGLTNCTLSGNVADQGAGGIENTAGSASVINSTFLNNVAASLYGGSITSYAPLEIQNSIVAYGTFYNCIGQITSLGSNLETAEDCGFTAVGDLQMTDPRLDGLKDNGGPTQTHLLLPGSPALDHISANACPPTDQRGLPRPQGSQCDIGAVERAAGMISPTGQMPWPMLGHDARRSDRGIAAGPQNAKVLGAPWPYLAPARVNTSVAVDYQGTAYFGLEDGSLHAVDRYGNQSFTFRTNGPVHSSPALVPVGYGPAPGEPWTPPVTSTVYFGSDDGYVYALDSGGTLRWTLRPGTPPNTSPIRSSPAAVKTPISQFNRVYVGADDGNVYAIFESFTGIPTTAWQFSTGAPLSTSPAVSPDGQVVYVGGSDGKLYCADAVSGALLPGTPIDLGQGALTTPAVDRDGQVYVATAAGGVWSYDVECRPRPYWHVKLGAGITAAPALGAGGEVLVLAGNTLYGISGLGNVGWSQSFGRPVGGTAPVVDSAGRAFVASSDGWLYGVAHTAGAPQGTLLWGIQVRPGGSPYLGQPALDGHGRIYLGASDNELDVIDDEPAFEIAFHSDLWDPANLDIYSLRETYGAVDPARSQRLTGSAAREQQPAFALDPSAMAYLSDRDSSRDAFLADSTGAQEENLTAPWAGPPFSSSSDEREPAFTPIDDLTGVSRLPDGRRYLAATTGASGMDRLVFVDLWARANGATRALSFTDWALAQNVPSGVAGVLEPPDTGQSAVAFAPDGRTLAWRDCDATQHGQVLLLQLDGLNSQVVPVGQGFYEPEPVVPPCQDAPAFAPDSRWLVVREGNSLAVYAAASPYQSLFVTPAPSGVPAHPNWSPDGSEIAVGVTAGTVDLSVASRTHYAVYDSLTSSGTSDEPYYHYFKLPPPQVQSLSTDRQYPGELILIYGRGFDILHPVDNQVYFTDTLHTTWLPAEVLDAAVDPRLGLGVLSVRVPDLAGNGQIRVQTRFGRATWAPFYVLPKPANVAQPRSVPGAKVRVFGTGFDLTPATQYQVLFSGSGGGWIAAAAQSGAVSGQQEYLVVEVPSGIAETGPVRVENAQGGRDCACTFARLHPTFTLQRTTGLPAYAVQGCDGIQVRISGGNFPYDPFFGYGQGYLSLVVVNTVGTPVPVTENLPWYTFSPTGSDTAGFGPSAMPFINLGPAHPGGDLDVQAHDSNLLAAAGHAPFRVPFRNLPIIFVAGTSGVSLDTTVVPMTYEFAGNAEYFPWICKTCVAGGILHLPRDFTYLPGLQDPTGPRVWFGPEGVETLLLDLPEFNRGNHYLDVLAFDDSGANTLFPNIQRGSVIRTLSLGPAGVPSMDFYEPLFHYLIDTLGRPLNSGANGLYPYLYDWRGDMPDQAAGLGSFIDQVLTSTGAPKVVVITHSLGGPVARSYYLSSPANAAKVDQVISIGGGFAGVTKPVKILAMGDTWGFGWGYGPLTAGLAEWEIEALAQNWGTAYFQAPNSEGWFADDVSRGGSYDRRYVADERLLGSPPGSSYSAHMNWIEDTYNGSIAGRADAFFQGLNPDVGNFGSGTGPVYHQRLFSLGVDTDGGPRLFSAPSALCAWAAATLNPIALVECVPVTWREPLIADGDGTVTYHGMLGLTDPRDDRTYVVRNVEHLDLAKSHSAHLLIGEMLAGATCSQPLGGANHGFSSHLQVEEGYKLPPPPGGPAAAEQTDASADHWLLRVRGGAGLDIIDDQGRHDGPTAGNPVLLEHNIPGLYTTPGQSFGYVSITAPGSYTITLSGTVSTALDIYVTPSAGSTRLDTTFFQGVPLTGSGKARVEIDTGKSWLMTSLDPLGNGNFEPVAPTAVLDAAASLDSVPPTTAISVANGNVTLSAADNPGGSGVLRTYYEAGDGRFQVYSGPFVAPPGATRVTAFSLDRNGNFEVPFATQALGRRIFLPLVMRNP